MSTLAFGVKPTALRCARCGRFVDWAESQLQTVCGCRPKLALPPVIVRQAEPEQRVELLALFRRDLGREAVVMAFGEMVSIEECPGILAELRGQIAGAVAYRLLPDALHIVALATDPMWQRSGVATRLVEEVEFLARRHGVARLVSSTTNDNLPALYFYQRRGWRITELVAGSMTSHVCAHHTNGFAGIPVRDEIRLEKVID
jgi:ribosomal protein S18 acetylase RimI-like enzyme